jgi:hypothetical protein
MFRCRASQMIYQVISQVHGELLVDAGVVILAVVLCRQRLAIWIR